MDCVEGMKLLPNECIDLTVTSPPYDNLRTYDGNIEQWSFEKFQEIAKELYRVTKQGGVVVWVVGDATINGSETGTSFRQALYFKEIGFNLHDTMIYLKDTPPQNRNRYEQQFEYMFVFSKGKPTTFNPIKTQKLWEDNRRYKKYFRNKEGRFDTKGTPKHNDTLKVIGNTWFYDVGGGKSTKDKIAFQHPAIFPEQLAQDHIISWSNEGDLVLDPFMGSGTTAKMAILNNRNFIGFEISKEYCDIANKRINKYLKPKTTD